MPMTEAQWRGCTSLCSMIMALGGNLEGRTSDRKLRLFACACCRRIASLFHDSRSGQAIEVAARFADGLASESERARAELDAFDTDPNFWSGYVSRAQRPPAPRLAAYAAGSTLCTDANLAAEDTSRIILDATPDNRIRREQIAHCQLLRHIVGNPFLTSPTLDRCRTSISQLAEAIYGGQDCAFALHDALLEAGQPELAEHFRTKEHPKGCFAVDLILGKS